MPDAPSDPMGPARGAVYGSIIGGVMWSIIVAMVRLYMR